MNRLATETSPYLLQHKANPVDWFPWGPEALERARREDKPIFLSIGYSACHWCHVMERESFENERIAALMNAGFVNVKVDREERPDLDDLYMRAVQSLTGSGGWPMSVFLTPDLEPFFGGTYFPPQGLGPGRPGFTDVLQSLGDAWQNQRENLETRAKRLTGQIARQSGVDARAKIDPGVLDRSLELLNQNFDPIHGGFGDAPKFPHATDLALVLRHAARTGASEVRAMVTFTLDRMLAGGIYDQLGGGFHRYSTDEEWLVPHFEKMLYDNALLLGVLLDAHLVTGEERYALGARETLEWVLREMRTEEGGLASTQDADTEGAEGRFFAWTPQELVSALGSERGGWAQEWFGVDADGNFEHGTSVLHRPEPAAEVARKLRLPEDRLTSAMAEARGSLWQEREGRARPATDDKVLASWNGLMISALSRAAQVLGDGRYAEAARDAARFVLRAMRSADGRLLATARAGHAKHKAGLDDYAFMIAGLIDLYETDFDATWIETALDLEASLEEHFADHEHGGYFTTPDDHEPLPARLKSPEDGALPAGNGVHALNLLRLAELTGRGELARRAERTITSMGVLVARYPHAFSQTLLAVDLLAKGPSEIVIAGEESHTEVRAMLRVVRGHFHPWRVVALADAGADRELMPLLEGKQPGPSGARAFVCRNYACGAPVDTAAELAEALADLD